MNPYGKQEKQARAHPKAIRSVMLLNSTSLFGSVRKRLFPNGRSKPTNYPLSIFCSESHNLHFDVGSTDGCEHQFHLIPHAEHRAAQDEIGPTPEPDFTLQAHWHFLTVPSPEQKRTQESGERKLDRFSFNI